MNAVNVIGRVATAPQLRVTPGDQKVCTFRLALERRRVGGEDRGAVFITVETWRQTAEVAAEYLTVGRQVGVSGRLERSEWEDEGGTRHERVYVVVDQLTFLDGRGREADAETTEG